MGLGRGPTVGNKLVLQVPAGTVGLREGEVYGFAILEGRLHSLVIYLLRAFRSAGLGGQVPVIDGPMHHHGFGSLCHDVHLQVQWMW